MNSNEVVVFESSEPKDIFCISPGLEVTPSGRIILTSGLRGKGVEKLPGIHIKLGGDGYIKGLVYYSDDKGTTWKKAAEFGMTQSRPFYANGCVYIIGQCGDVAVLRSHDDGETWEGPFKLTQGEIWHQAPSNVWFTSENIYLVMEKTVYNDVKGWPVSALAPVLMRARLDSDLTKRESWTFASELAFRDAVNEDELDYFGVPFYRTFNNEQYFPAPKRDCAPMGWLETNVVQILDEDHYWHDPDGNTYHLLMRAHTEGTGYAAIAKVVENEDGTMKTMLETVPSGRKAVFIPFPGGQMKFHVVYDEFTRLYWLVSTQATDSMTRAERLPEDRYNLPNNERQRLVLHYSKNCVDWCFACLVAKGATQKEARHYASMVISGDDIYIASRSGDHRAASAHNGNITTFHTIKNFRSLIY